MINNLLFIQFQAIQIGIVVGANVYVHSDCKQIPMYRLANGPPPL